MFNFKPLDALGDHLKNLIKDRRMSGIKYNDLIETLYDAVDNGKAKLTENEIIGKKRSTNANSL